MKKIERVRVTTTDWAATLLQVESGDEGQLEIMAEEANRIRVKASELTTKGQGKYSIAIEGNIATITNKAE